MNEKEKIILDFIDILKSQCTDEARKNIFLEIPFCLLCGGEKRVGMKCYCQDEDNF